MFGCDNIAAGYGEFRTICNVAARIDLRELVNAGLVSVMVKGKTSLLPSIHFYGEPGPPGQDTLLACISATESRQQVQAVEIAAASNAGAVVFRELAASDVRARCRELEITLAVLEVGVDWSQLVWFVRSILDRGKTVVGPELPAQQGLFAMADAFAAMLNAPVTIEDSHSRVVAYSATTEGADLARTSTIMTRAVPASVLRQLSATGVLKKVARTDRPFIVPMSEPGFLQRLVIPLRLGGQAVGSIWVIWAGKLDPQLETQLTTMATATALSLVQLNASLDLAGRYSLEVIRAALREGTTEAATSLDLPFSPVRIVALQSLSSRQATDDVLLWRNFLRKKSWSDPILADVDGLLYGIVSEHSGPGGWVWLQELARAGAPGRIAGSRPRSDSRELPAARREAAEALAAVCSLGYPVASYEEVWDTVVLRRACAAVSAVEHERLRILRDSDRHGAQQLASTLRVWLECGGDIRETAALMHLHPNTVRHRLKKIDRLVGRDLQTHTQRLAAWILLRGWDEAQSTDAR